MAKKRIPVLLFNTTKEDREACQFVMASGMPCELLATGDEKTPMLVSRAQEFRGLKEIKEYVEGWKKIQRERCEFIKKILVTARDHKVLVDISFEERPQYHRKQTTFKRRLIGNIGDDENFVVVNPKDATIFLAGISNIRNITI